jgi:hypothetical protein
LTSHFSFRSVIGSFSPFVFPFLLFSLALSLVKNTMTTAYLLHKAASKLCSNQG